MFTRVDVNRLRSRAGNVRLAIAGFENRSAHRENPDNGLAELADVVSALCGYLDLLRQDFDDLKHGVITQP
jgi:hypothetical protein